MPFRSKAQLRYLMAKHPKIAKRWMRKYGVSANLPDYVHPRKSHPYSPAPRSSKCMICGLGRDEHSIK